MVSHRIDLPSAPPDQHGILDAGGVAVWREPVEIGTYEPEEPTEFPMFLDRRVYQGSSGRVYPLPFTERIGRERRLRLWDAIHLENRFVRLMLLPELGGRIHIGYDKTTGYDFFYRNNVIKPALVGLAGPWISGGVEFNWPQHHRPGTFLPVETAIERNDDRSVVVWHSDHDPFARMAGTHGVLLRPESSLIELQVRLHNRTEEPQTFLWWANVAARSSDEYQSFFPTDVRFVADHARRAVTSFPRADRPYYGVDYPARVSEAHPDADRLDFYRNIPVPTSYMVLDTQDDFFGGYDHGAHAGFVHWADRRIAPGKKQWTWGNAPFGHAWDRLLTDDDGPYVELMAGVFTDNQPDFSYLGPDEVRTFSQYWYPISRIGIAHQATRDAALSVEVVRNGVVRIGIAVTAEQPLVEIEVGVGMALQRVEARIAPDQPFVHEMELEGVDAAHDVTVSVRAGDSELVGWRAHTTSPTEPAVATEPPPAQEISSADELYLTGVHLGQYRHPTRSPLPYFAEVLRRDPGDSRANLALAAHHYRAAEFGTAEEHARRALGRLTARNPNPGDGEASYRLGLILARQGRTEEARDSFAKAAWDVKWAQPARLASAFAASRLGHLRKALEELGDCGNVGRGRGLRISLLRQLGDGATASAELDAMMALDPLDAWGSALAGGTPTEPWTAVDVAIDAEAAGDLQLALRMLEGAAHLTGPGGNAAPVALYLAALFLERAGDAVSAAGYRARARAVEQRLCFPSGLAAEEALRAALRADPADLHARALLGTWLYGAGRRADALSEWTFVIESGGADEVVLRNAAVAAVNVLDDTEFAAQCYDRAIGLAPRQSRLWLERDTLSERRGVSAEARLSALDQRPADALERDDLIVVTAELLSSTGRPGEAHALLAARELQPWEGGEGRSIAAWEQSCLGLARAALATGDAQNALSWTDTAEHTPPSLGEARHLLAGIAEIHVVRGDALAASGDETAAAAAWSAALVDPSAPSDGLPATAVAYWVGVAAGRLGDAARAEATWVALDAAADAIEAAAGAPDYFATSLPSTLLFDISPAVVRREADHLRGLARQGRGAVARRPG